MCTALLCHDLKAARQRSCTVLFLSMKKPNLTSRLSGQAKTGDMRFQQRAPPQKVPPHSKPPLGGATGLEGFVSCSLSPDVLISSLVSVCWVTLASSAVVATSAVSTTCGRESRLGCFAGNVASLFQAAWLACGSESPATHSHGSHESCACLAKQERKNAQGDPHACTGDVSSLNDAANSSGETPRISVASSSSLGSTTITVACDCSGFTAGIE